MNILMERIIAVVAGVLNVSVADLDENAAMDVTDGWDSLKTMEIVIAIERNFQLVFTAQQMMAQDSVRSIYDALIQSGVEAS